MIEVLAVKNPLVTLVLADGAEVGIHVVPTSVRKREERTPDGDPIYEVKWQSVMSLIAKPTDPTEH